MKWNKKPLSDWFKNKKELLFMETQILKYENGQFFKYRKREGKWAIFTQRGVCDDDVRKEIGQGPAPSLLQARKSLKKLGCNKVGLSGRVL